MDKRFLIISVAILVAAMMIIPEFSNLGMENSSISQNKSALLNAPSISIPQNELRDYTVRYAPGSVISGLTQKFAGNMNVLVTFNLQNQTLLNSFLSNISNPANREYHHYISRAQFAREFGASSSSYSQASIYFSQFPGISVTSFHDRVSIQVKGPASSIGKAFNTTISTASGGFIYHATSIPQLPLYLADQISQVTGLTNSPVNYSLNMVKNPSPVVNSGISYTSGYPSPLSNSGVQNIYGSDLQVAYNEQSLLNITYPTGEVVATILWAGHNSNNINVAPFNPSDVYNYFNKSLPSYEPHSSVYGVPLNGAAPPGPSASQDCTGAYMENTLDLEMVGSTAPGSSIYNVYGPNATTACLDSAFNFILNPNTPFSKLQNVSVITNSWGAPEYNDTIWYSYLQEAQARGITVLASSGDSGDNTDSKKYSANPTYPGDFVQFPSNMAFNNFGITSVGGTTLTLNSNLHISNQKAWYQTSASAGGNASGSTGGISQVIPESNWQAASSANNILQGKGLGVPDIAAIGNNTLVCLTVGSSQKLYGFGGTSVASPVEAGIVAEINAVMHKYNQSSLGYLNPVIFRIANLQYQSPPTTSSTGYLPSSPRNYNSSLPTLPFYDVTTWRNHIYRAGFGYDLVTGWGSIDAYNLSMYVMNASKGYFAKGLKGVSDKLALNGLNVTTYLYNSTSGKYSNINGFYNASIQQNLFLANQFGAPIYWIQNVIYINGSQKTGWVMNYTGWVIYPFYGQYPSLTLYRYNFPAGKIVSIPHTFNISTWLTNLSVPMEQTVNFQVNSHTLSIPVPGAAYIIEGRNYTYNWNGHTYFNGPYPDNPNNGGLNPEFGIVGGPSGGDGFFKSPTSGSINAYVMPLGSTSYIPASTKVFGSNIDQTGESASYLHFNRQSNNIWDLSTNSSSTAQGIVDCENQTSPVTFAENGLPPGTNWYVNLSNGQSYNSTGGTISLFESNGTYSYTIESGNSLYSTNNTTGNFTVSGKSLTINVNFVESTYPVYFNETGLSNGLIWYVNLSTGSSYYATSGSTLSLSLSNGSYNYAIGYEKGYTSSPSTGTIKVTGAKSSITITFTHVTSTTSFYSVFVNETGLASGNEWYVNLTNGQHFQSNTSSITFNETNGTYYYTASTSNSSFSITNGNGKIFVNGSGYSINLTFNQDRFAVSFIQSGLNRNAIWYVNISGLKSSGQISSKSYTEYLKNASYQYSISTNYKNYSASGGTFTVIGNALQENIIFKPVYFNVTFNEIGLPKGDTWQVTLNKVTVVSKNTSISFQEQNGTYGFSANSSKLYTASPAVGHVVVSGNSRSYSISFTSNSSTLFKIWFNETGLPSGNTWYLNITGEAGSGLINSTSYETSLTDRNYSYSVYSINRSYHPYYNGSFTVNGSGITNKILFKGVLFKMNFKETGLSSGITWYVNLSNGKTSGPISGNNYSFFLANGTYGFSISKVAGYNATPPSGHKLIQGGNVSITVAFTTGNNQGPGIYNELLLVTVGIIALVALILIGVSRYRKIK